MPSVRVRDNEPFDIAIRRFKRACEKGCTSRGSQTGVLRETNFSQKAKSCSSYKKMAEKKGRILPRQRPRI